MAGNVSGSNDWGFADVSSINDKKTKNEKRRNQIDGG